MKTEKTGKAPYTENINTHVLSGWCVQSTFASRDVPDPLKVYCGKDCLEKCVKRYCMQYFHNNLRQSLMMC